MFIFIIVLYLLSSPVLYPIIPFVSNNIGQYIVKIPSDREYDRS